MVNGSLQILIERFLLSLKRCVFLDLALSNFNLLRQYLGPIHPLRGISGQNYVVFTIVRLGRLEIGLEEI